MKPPLRSSTFGNNEFGFKVWHSLYESANKEFYIGNNNQSRRTRIMGKLTPLADRVVVRPQDAEETTKGGLIIPDTAKEKPQKGTVVAVGPGKVENGTKVDMTVSEGDVVLYGKYAGTEVSIDDEDVLIMRESYILGIVS